MRYFVVFLLALMTTSAWSQKDTLVNIKGTVVNSTTKLPLSNVNVINATRVTGTATTGSGTFAIATKLNDTLLFSYIGYETVKVKVTNDWIKNKTTKIQMTEKAIALEEIIIQPYYLTGYLEVDSKLIPSPDNYRYSISGLPQGYEAGEYSPNAFGNILGSMFNPADALYNFFGKKGNQLKRLKQIKKDETVRNLLESKFDRETLATLLGIDKKEIAEILDRCNYSEAFIKTANDLQIMDAISGCYEEYKVLKKK